MPELSRRVQTFTDSVIRRMTRISDEVDAINLSQGFPDFPPPKAITDRLREVADEGPHQYSVTFGAENFREALARKQGRAYGREINPDTEILVTCGGTEAMMSAMMTVCNPSNPCGKVFTKDELLFIGGLSNRYDAYMITDEVYEHIVFAPYHHVYAGSLPEIADRVICCSSLSKTYSITGWRLGYLCAPKELVTQMHKIHQYAIMCAPTTSQLAAIEALKHGDPDIEMMANEYNRRRKYILDGLRKMGIDTFEAEGAFYVFPRIGKFGLSSDDFCQKLLDEKGVAIVPGNAFGDCGEGYARISYAYSVEHITEALKRMNEFIQELF